MDYSQRRFSRTEAARIGAQRLAVVSGGTIPDRGLFSVNLLDDGKKVGELDEEMVYEMRPGEVFILGATSWRVADITPSQVMVTPAPGEPGRIAFWHGDALGRPVEVGRAMGQAMRELTAMEPDAAIARLQERSRFDDRAASNLMDYLSDQAAATGTVWVARLLAPGLARGVPWSLLEVSVLLLKLLKPCTILGVTRQKRKAKMNSITSVTTLKPEQPSRRGGLYIGYSSGSSGSRGSGVFIGF